MPVVALAKEALQHTRPRPVSPYYSDMSLEMAEQFNASLTGDMTPEEAARTLKERAREHHPAGPGSLVLDKARGEYRECGSAS